MGTQDKNRAVATAVSLIQIMDETEIKTIEEEVIKRMQVLGCESDLASAKERSARAHAYNKKAWAAKKKGQVLGWDKRADSIDEAKLARGMGFFALGGGFLKEGETPSGCILRRLPTGDYVALKDGIELATTSSGPEAAFDGDLAKVNSHPHARVLWALWKELRS